MTQDEIVKLAREADREWDCDRDMVEWLECFAALVAAAEREACAQIIQSYMDSEHIDDPGWNVARDILNDIQGKKEQ